MPTVNDPDPIEQYRAGSSGEVREDDDGKQ
jgi:hypothetical protein